MSPSTLFEDSSSHEPSFLINGVTCKVPNSARQEQLSSLFGLSFFGMQLLGVRPFGLQVLATPWTKIYLDAGLSAIVNKNMMSATPHAYQVIRAIVPTRVLVAFLV
jgi:hypothetical protein